MAEGVGHGALDGWSGFCAVGVAARHGQTLFLPDMATHGGESVVERQALLSIPGRCCQTAFKTGSDAIMVQRWLPNAGKSLTLESFPPLEALS